MKLTDILVDLIAKEHIYDKFLITLLSNTNHCLHAAFFKAFISFISFQHQTLLPSYNHGKKQFYPSSCSSV